MRATKGENPLPGRNQLIRQMQNMSAPLRWNQTHGSQKTISPFPLWTRLKMQFRLQKSSIC